MMIESTRDGGSAVLRVAGRLDREGAEHLSQSLEELLRDGVRSVAIDLSTVTYISSAATTVLSRWRQELAALRGEVQLTSLPPAVREALAILGWDRASRRTPGPGPRTGRSDLRLSSWQIPSTIARSGEYQMSAGVPDGMLRCRLHGSPDWLRHVPLGSDDCEVVALPANSFGLGLGAIGGAYDDCRDGLGELLAVAGCVAHFPNDGARMADYLVGDGAVAPRAVLASGLTCEGAFSKLVRFSPQPDVDVVPLSEVAGRLSRRRGWHRRGSGHRRGDAGSLRGEDPAVAGRARCAATGVRGFGPARLAVVHAGACVLADHDPGGRRDCARAGWTPGGPPPSAWLDG